MVGASSSRRQSLSVFWGLCAEEVETLESRLWILIDFFTGIPTPVVWLIRLLFANIEVVADTQYRIWEKLTFHNLQFVCSFFSFSFLYTVYIFVASNGDTVFVVVVRVCLCVGHTRSSIYEYLYLVPLNYFCHTHVPNELKICFLFLVGKPECVRCIALPVSLPENISFSFLHANSGQRDRKSQQEATMESTILLCTIRTISSSLDTTHDSIARFHYNIT